MNELVEHILRNEPAIVNKSTVRQDILVKVLKWCNQKDEVTRAFLADLSLESLVMIGRICTTPRVKTPKELKKERGDLMRAKREAKRAAQVRS